MPCPLADDCRLLLLLLLLLLLQLRLLLVMLMLTGGSWDQQVSLDCLCI